MDSNFQMCMSCCWVRWFGAVGGGAAVSPVQTLVPDLVHSICNSELSLVCDAYLISHRHIFQCVQYGGPDAMSQSHTPRGRFALQPIESGANHLEVQPGIAIVTSLDVVLQGAVVIVNQLIPGEDSG